MSELPENWISITDPSSGRTYYANTVTRETRWVRPTKDEASTEGKSDWEERVDQSTGRIYYVNTRTKESTWNKPEKIQFESREELPPNWEVRSDPSSGKLYYVNTVTKASQWDKPIPEDSELPPNWQRRTDAKTGKTYYINVVTMTSVWEKPTFENEKNLVVLSQTIKAEAKVEAAMAELANHDTSPTSLGQLTSKPFKFVAVGDGTVGKTCLLITFTKNEFPEEYVPTVFDNYTAMIRHKEKDYAMALWDTAGQEEYDRLRPLSYPNTDCFLVCFSIARPSSLENAQRKWKNELAHYCPDAKLILIGTKKDLRNDNETINELAKQGTKPITSLEAEKISKSMDCFSYLECSAKTREGIREVFIEAVVACVEGKKKKKKSFCSVL